MTYQEALEVKNFAEKKYGQKFMIFKLGKDKLILRSRTQTIENDNHRYLVRRMPLNA